MGKSKPNTAHDLITLLARATVNDLAAIDTEINRLEADLNAIVSERKKTIDAMKVARRTVDFAVNGKTKRKTPVRRKASEADNEPAVETGLKNEIYDLLFKEGPMPVPAIAARLGRRAAGVGISVSRCEWFERDNGDVRIAKSGGGSMIDLSRSIGRSALTQSA